MRVAACALLLLQDSAPIEWKPFAARDEIAPRTWVEKDGDAVRLGLAGRGDDSVDGRWMRSVPVVSGTTYVFSARFRAKNVPAPTRNVLARVVWLDASGKPQRPMEYPYPGPSPAEDGWTALTGTYVAPEKAAQARLELHLRWAAHGEVLFRDIGFRATDPPAPRKVRLATVHHHPRGTKSARENLERFGRLVDEAGRRKADIVCLPEGLRRVGTAATHAEASEPVPGPSTAFFGELAARHKLWIVAGLYEREGARIYNTAVLLDRNGKLAGKYRKVCLPDEEIEGGLTPGREYPVFDTDFGRVGMMICWDVHFPEVARELCARGAEVLLVPIWGGNELLTQARATENQVYVVASGYNFRTGIFDRTGKRIADAAQDPEVLVTDVDLNERTLWPWLGEWRARIWREGPARPGR